MGMDICQEREHRGQNSKACPQVADTFSGGRKKESECQTNAVRKEEIYIRRTQNVMVIVSMSNAAEK